MRKLNSKLTLTALAAAALVAGCGGGGGGDSAAVADPPTQASPSAMNSIDLIKNMIANNSENSDPDDIDAITLAVDDTADPSTL